MSIYLSSWLFFIFKVNLISLYSYADTSVGAKHNISCFDDSLSADVQIMQLRAAPQPSFRHRNRNQISRCEVKAHFMREGSSMPVRLSTLSEHDNLAV